MKKNILSGIAVLLTSALMITGCSSGEKTSTTASTEAPQATATAQSAYNPTPLEEGKTYFADIDIKDFGLITVKLDQSAAPVTCANFVQLANEGFYNGLTFHRIMDGFMMQGGDPTGTGMGGSDNDIIGEFEMNGHKNPISHTRGTISMARSQAPDSASSQFFIVHQDSTFLDGQYAGFGTVTEGIEIVDKICTSSQPTDNNGTIPAEAQPVINTVTIRVE